MTPDLLERRRRLDAARSTFDVRDPAPDDLAPEVGESWRRCAGLLSVGHTAPSTLPDADSLWSASPIRRAAPDIVDDLSRLATSEDYIAAVTDGDGHIIWSAAGRSMARLAEQVNFVRGADWREAAAGTNAPGLALHTGRPAAVFATEHWCEGVQDWVCYAAPVRARSGRLLGVLDLSSLWRRASPLALTTVVAMSRLVEQLLLASPWGRPDLRLSVLGTPRAEVGGRPVRVSQRQVEILTILAVRGQASFEELHDLLYGERPVSAATLKSEISHLRQLLGGAIESRPYRLALAVEADVVDALAALRSGDTEGAVRLYAGQLLPTSESPFLTDLRHHLDVGLRTALLQRGHPDQLLRFADIHPYDTEILEYAGTLIGPGDPHRGDLAARLAHACE
jgi:hypothetical protein